MLSARITRALGAFLGALLACSALVLAAPTPAFACSCESPDLARQSERADVVFVATIDSVTEVGKQFEYAVTATRAYKGEVERETTVRTAQDTSACGLGELRPGTDYLFLATGTQMPFKATSCSGSGPQSVPRVTQVEEVLGEGEAILPPTPPDPTMTKMEDSPPPSAARLAAPGAALVLVGALGLLVVNRRRKTA